MKFLLLFVEIVFLLALFCLIVYAPWYMLGPETFWQRFFCVVIIELPVALISGMACVGFGLMFAEYIEEKVGG
jgi:hypothetical protein